MKNDVTDGPGSILEGPDFVGSPMVTPYFSEDAPFDHERVFDDPLWHALVIVQAMVGIKAHPAAMPFDQLLALVGEELEIDGEDVANLDRLKPEWFIRPTV